MTANAWCPIKRREWVAAEAPQVSCSWHHLSDTGLLTFWPPEYRQWARDRGLDYTTGVPAEAAFKGNVQPPHADEDAGGGDHRDHQHQALAIISPPSGATYLIDPTLRREFQTLQLRAVAVSGGPIEWSVAGRVVGSADADRAIEWPLAPGQHRIVARDRQGRTAEATVSVR